MSKAFDSIAQGLQEAIDVSAGKCVSALTHQPNKIDVAAKRAKDVPHLARLQAEANHKKLVTAV